MAASHIAEPGEYIASIAADYGFSSSLTIWHHPENAALKALRKNPNTLLPGDIVYIPDRQTKVYPGQTEKHHIFVREQTNPKLRIVLRDENDQPVANAPCKLKIDGNVYDLNTDDQGLCEQPISYTAQEGTLIILGNAAGVASEIPVKIGHLHPIEEMTGVQARLNNLGYDAGEVGGGDQEMLRSAVQEFQLDHGMTPDGKWEAPFQAKLKEVYGC